MPNIQVDIPPKIELPLYRNGYKFEYQTKFCGNRSLIFVTYNSYRFFLDVIIRDKNVLIKAEKITRFSPVYIIKDAINILAKECSLNILYSNIDSKKSNIHLKEFSKYLKDIDYFIDSFLLPKRCIVEIGFGSGRHLLYQAKNSPDILYIGIEIHKPSLEQLIKQCKIQSIDNILILDYDARGFLELLPSKSLDKIYIHFPVPWDKSPDRRVISLPFLKLCNKILKKDATLELRTDSQNYYHYSYSTINLLDQFNIYIKKNSQVAISSKYEDRWLRQKKNIYDILVKNSSPKGENIVKFKIEFEEDFYRYFQKFLKVFHKKIVKQKDCFVNFESIYSIDDFEGICKVTLGSYQFNEHKYIVFKDKRVQYLPNKLIPIESNFNAHNLLVDYIKKRCGCLEI
jgi:tRNA (guanine-N7-)-methyltransferase